MAALRGSCSPTLFRPAETHGRVNNVVRDNDAIVDLMVGEDEDEVLMRYDCARMLDNERNGNWLEVYRQTFRQIRSS